MRQSTSASACWKREDTRSRTEVLQEIVILSGAVASRSEATAESKDPRDVWGEMNGARHSHERAWREFLATVSRNRQRWGPSTALAFAPQTPTSLRMTGFRVDLKEHSYFVYIVSSSSGTLYIGMCNNLERRMKEHKSGEMEGFASKYHCNRLP